MERPADSRPDPASVDAARQAIRETRPADATPAVDEAAAVADADAHPDDPEVTGYEGAELLKRTLGAEIIEEIPHH